MLAQKLEQAQEKVLEVRNLTKVFGYGSSRIVAVDNVSFSIRKGEVISLLGESGSGKTTVARLILRLSRPTSGSILSRGADIYSSIRRNSEAIEYWRHIQAIFQDPFASFNNFYGVKRVLNNAFRLVPNDLSAADKEERIRQALSNVGLNPGEVLKKRVHEMSGGQRQRIMIARVLLINPEILVADEPTSMIDASSRAAILNLLLDLRRTRGMSILFITHDIGLAYYTSDTLLIMNKGKIVEQGDAGDIITNPRDPYTQKLLSDVPVIHKKWEL